MSSSTLLKSNLNGKGRRCGFLNYNGELIITTEGDRPHRVVDISADPAQHSLKVLPLGIQSPYEDAVSSWSVTGVDAGGSMEEGTYYVCLTWFAPELNLESLPSPRKKVVLGSGHNAIQLECTLIIPLDLDLDARDWVRHLRVYRSLVNDPDVTEDIPQETAGNYYRCEEFDFRSFLTADGHGATYYEWSDPVNVPAGTDIARGDIFRTASIGSPGVVYRYMALHDHKKDAAGTTLGDGAGTDQAVLYPTYWQNLGGDPIFLTRPDEGENGIAYMPSLDINKGMPQAWWDIEEHRGLIYYTGSSDEQVTFDLTNGSDIFAISGHLNTYGSGYGRLHANTGWIGRAITMLESYQAQDVAAEGQIPPIGDTYVVTHVMNEWQVKVRKFPLDESWGGYEGTTRYGVQALVRQTDGEIAFCVTDPLGGNYPIADYVPGSNRLYNRPKEGGRNQCLMSSGEVCYVFADQNVSYFTGPQSQIRNISDMRVYTEGKRGVCRDKRGYVYFVGPDGLYMLDGTPNPPRRFNDNVSDFWHQRSHSTWGWNMDFMHRCSVEYHPRLDRIYIWGPSRGWPKNNLCLVFDIETQSFYVLIAWVDGDRTQQVVYSDVTWQDTQQINGRQELLFGGMMQTPKSDGAGGWSDTPQKNHYGRQWLTDHGMIDEVPRDKVADLRDHDIHWERTFTPASDPDTGLVMGVQAVEIHTDPRSGGGDFRFALYEHPPAGNHPEVVSGGKGFFIRTDGYHVGSFQGAVNVFYPAPSSGNVAEPVVYGFASREQDRGVIRGILVHPEAVRQHVRP